MSLTTQEVPVNAYMRAGKAKQSNSTAKNVVLAEFDHLSTGSIIWFLVKRHKVGVLSTWAVVITTLYLFPFVPSLVLSLFN